jgi:hypothetical protein
MNLDELAKRLVKCKHFRWMEGMLSVYWQGDRRWVWRLNEQDDHLSDSDSFPDLTDPATIGCLLHLVRAAWGDDSACSRGVYYLPEGWSWSVTRSHLSDEEPPGHNSLWKWYLRDAQYATEAEALVAALEAAP